MIILKSETVDSVIYSEKNISPKRLHLKKNKLKNNKSRRKEEKG